VIDEQTYYYDSPDGLGRLTSSVHSRTGTTTYDSYTASGNLLQATAPGSRVTTYGYDVMGRPITVDAPDTPNAAAGQPDYTNITHTAYTDRGEVRATWGGQTYPKRYQYDAQGRMTHLHTYTSAPAGEPTANGDSITSWVYSANRGFLLEKNYHGENGVADADYTYTAAGRLQTRTWERGVVTTYGYTLGTHASPGSIHETTYTYCCAPL